MLEGLFGSLYKERVLVFIFSRQKGYAREIAQFYNIALTPVLNQLKTLEENGILVSATRGKTIIYQFNPRYPFLQELKAMLEKLINFYPEDIKQKLLFNRRRPRRRNKQL
ncbi:MAG: winged helix-turn-helix transcriptional regulator [Candidatus Cloacimonetes bacterium]|nr:winged helix-turn-helix transcriptional regulator [Candidatus Cloacimonadota bacterium]